MKLLLLHGPAKDACRKKLISIKQQFDPNNVVVFEEGSDIQTILGTLATPSLFSDSQLVILENPPEDLTFDSFDSYDSLTLVLWFDHEVNQKNLQGEVLFFPEAKEVSVFPFLDYLAVRDKKAFLELDKLKKAGFEIQYFITMVFYLLRNLVTTPKNAPAFVKDKLQRQRRNFSLDKITQLYGEILEIDFKIKSGLLEKDQAEFSLLSTWEVV